MKLILRNKSYENVHYDTARIMYLIFRNRNTKGLWANNFFMLNRFCLLSTHPPPIPLFLTHGCINHLNLEMEPKCLTKSDVQLNPNILRTKKMIKGCCKKH